MVRQSAEKAAPRSALSAQQLMTVVTELVIWIDKVGLPLEPAVVFHPDHIDRFVLEGCAHLAPGTRTNYRGQLRSVGAAVLGPELFPLAPLPISRPEPLTAYSPSDIALLRSWGRGMPTELFRQGIATIMSFCLGSGLTSPELFNMAGTDVRVDTEGVTVHVTGERARHIPVLDIWADEVAQVAEAVRSGPVFAPHRTGKGTGRSRVANFIATCPKGDAPALTPSRLRNTWIIAHINAGTHFITLTQAAGVAPEAIARLARYAVGPVDAVANQMLRGAGLP